MTNLATRQTILVVDDDASVLQSIADILDFIGYGVVMAQTVAGGRAVLTARPADDSALDLVLADLRLPDGHGTELAPQAEAMGLPCVLMSGDQDDAATVLAAGYPFLAKPFSMAQLGTVLGQHLAVARPDRLPPARQLNF